jgi:hypothetical protein
VIDVTDDDRAAEWIDDDAPTFVEGALPEMPDDPDDEDTTLRTVARCSRCLRPVKTGGDAARPTFEEMETNAPDHCYRSMSGAWRWCSGRRPWQLVIEGGG